MEVIRTFCEHCGQDIKLNCSCASVMEQFKMTLSEFDELFNKEEKDVVDKAHDAADEFINELTQEDLNIFLEDLEHDDECDVIFKEHLQELGVGSDIEPECECEFPYVFFIFSKESGELLNYQGPMQPDYFRGAPPEEIPIPIMVWIGMTVRDLKDCLDAEIGRYDELWLNW